MFDGKIVMKKIVIGIVASFWSTTLVMCAEMNDFPKVESDKTETARGNEISENGLDTHNDLGASDADGDADTDGDSDADGDGDSDGDSNKNDDGKSGKNGSGDKTNTTINYVECSEQEFKIEKFIVRLAILVDISSSMNNAGKWQKARKAILSTLKKYDYMLDIGFDTFPAGIGGRSLAAVMCGLSNRIAVDCGPENGDKIRKKMAFMTPMPYAFTPLGCAMKQYTKNNYAPNCTDKHFPSYLLIISDGQDTCGLQCLNPVVDFNNMGTKKVDEAQYTTITKELHGKGVKTFVVGFGQAADPDDLNAIAAAGGTTQTQYIDARDGATLEKALNKIAGSVVSCSFEFGEQDNPDINLDETNLYSFNVKGEKVQLGHDQGCQKGKGGWTWANNKRTIIDLCEKTCQDLKKGVIRGITATFGCPTVIVV